MTATSTGPRVKEYLASCCSGKVGLVPMLFLPGSVSLVSSVWEVAIQSRESPSLTFLESFRVSHFIILCDILLFSNFVFTCVSFFQAVK